MVGRTRRTARILRRHIGCHTWQDQGFQHCNLRRTPDGGALLMPHHRNKTSESSRVSQGKVGGCRVLSQWSASRGMAL